MKQAEAFVLAWAGALMVAVILYLGEPLMPWHAWLSDPAAPAWVQAVGSILAILVAAYAAGEGGRQFRRDAERRERDELLRSAEHVRTLAQIAQSGLLHLKAWLEVPGAYTESKAMQFAETARNLLDLEADLARIPVHAFVPQVAWRLIPMGFVVRSVRRACEAALADPEPTGGFMWQNMSVRDTLIMNEQLLSSYIRELDGDIAAAKLRVV